MSGLDRIRPPEKRPFWVSLLIAAITILGLIASLSWWLGSVPRFSIALAVSCIAGWALSAWIARSVKRRKS